MEFVVSFSEAKEKVKALKKVPTNEEKALLYGLYKQATVGNINIQQPFILSFVETTKWNAWNKQKDKSTDEAETAYIETVAALINKYGTS